LTRAIVAGVGMIPFKKPYAANVYVAMGSEAARRALADAGLAYTNIQQAYVG
jgi:sterol carrier protein 2